MSASPAKVRTFARGLLAFVFCVLATPIVCLVCRAQTSFEQATPARKLIDAGSWICAVDAQEEVQCWLEVRARAWPSPTIKSSPSAFQKVPGLGQVTAIDGDDDYVCALDRRGLVHCWGSIWTHDMQRLWPMRIALTSPARQLAVSSGAGCALLDTGEVQCWGMSICLPGVVSSQRIIRLSEEPQTIELQVKPIQISAGQGAFCVLDGRGEVTCWGDMCRGHVDHACMLPTRMPVRDVQAIASLCGIVGKEREVECWGGRDAWQTPESSADSKNYCKPSRLRSVKHVKQLAVGYSSGLVLTDEGAVYHWGDGHAGDLLSLGRDVEAAQTISMDHARQQGDFGAAFEEPKPEVRIGPSKPVSGSRRFSLAPRRLPHVPSVKGVIASGHYDCLELADGGPLCEFVLGRVPFRLEQVWPSVRFDAGRSSAQH